MPNLTRDQLFSLPEQGQRDEFIEIATHALNAQPLDAELRLALLRCLTEVGLLHRAAETAAGFEPGVLGSIGLDGLLQQLRVPTRNGLVDWRAVRPTFDRNIELIEARYPWADRVRSEFEARRASMELHRTREGRWELFDRNAGIWRPCFGRHQPAETIENIRRQVENRVIAPIVIEGVGLGAQFPLYVSATYRTMNSSSPFIYLIETDWTALAVALHLSDWSELIRQPRAVICAGPDAYEQLDRSIAATPDAPLPKSIAWTPAWTSETGERAEPILRKHADRQQMRLRELRDELNRRYESRDASYWADRFESALRGDGPALRVLSITCRFTTVLQYATRDALAALESIGCETRVVIEPDDQSHISPIGALETIREFDPDLVLLIDHTRVSQPGILIDNLPVLTWIQDRLPWLFDQKVGHALGDLDFVMGQSRRDLVGRYGYPAERFMACDMATDVVQLTAPLPNGLDASRLDCEIAFATHASETPSDFAATRMAECDNPQGRAILEAIQRALIERQRDGILNGALNFQVFVAAIEASLGASLSTTARDGLIDQFARPLAERMIRQETLRWAARWARSTGGRLHIYGDGWEKHPEFAEFARGTIEHGPELGEAFRRAKVNLHSGCNLSLHQRVLDGLSAGGFFLARRHAGDVGLQVKHAIRAFLRKRGVKLPTKAYGTDLPSPWHREFERLCWMKGIDPRQPLEFNEKNAARIAAVCDGSEIMLADQLWPDFEDLTFAGEAEFVDRLEYFLARPELRLETAGRMRVGVLEHFGFEKRMRDVLAFTTDCLIEQRAAVGAGFEESNVNAVAEANV
ncbi:MAG: glycosyltransferase family 1 protein [Phycisphaerales bacterium]|nr:glycosyltransferase family 1 protein [Phycisphaerales bacterium]MCB9862487.1 glycosyltransferase family 1 protein [Phycisphaerales bacterium]